MRIRTGNIRRRRRAGWPLWMTGKRHTPKWPAPFYIRLTMSTEDIRAMMRQVREGPIAAACGHVAERR